MIHTRVSVAVAVTYRYDTVNQSHFTVKQLEEQVSFLRYHSGTEVDWWRPPYTLGPEWWYKLNLPWVVLGFTRCLFGFLAHSLCVWARFLKHTSNGWKTSEAGCQLNFKNSLALLKNLKCLTLCWAWLELQPNGFPWLISEYKSFMEMEKKKHPSVSSGLLRKLYHGLCFFCFFVKCVVFSLIQ